MKISTARWFPVVVLIACVMAATSAHAQQARPFSPSALVKNGDAISYGSYRIIRLGSGIYQIKDPGDPKAKAGGLIGVDMYLVRGASNALLIDLGNNYLGGYPGDAIPPRPHAAEELRAVVDGLRGRLPFEIALTHAHPDHDGMTRAFTDSKVTIWMPKGEDLEAPGKQHGNIDPSVYTIFDHATKTFDLGGGRVVKPLLVRGHSNGCTAYLLAKDRMLFTGDSIGIGAGRSLRSAASLRLFAEDTLKLVEYLKGSLAPHDRYVLKVYTGHSAENAIAGFYSENHPMLDLDHLDWRFVQDQALCANAILKGMWLVPDSGLRQMEVTNKQNGRRVNVMLYGIGAIEIPLEAAYEAAGLTVPFGSAALAQPKAAFDASTLVKPGDEVKYGSYLVRRIGDGAYQINDPGDQSTKGGGWGVDMYLVCGTRKALLIDLGNNYVAGYEKDALKPRPNAAQEFLAVVHGLVGRLSLEVAVTHMHPDHDGMAVAFAGRNVPMWAGDGEDLSALKNQHGLDPSIFRTFKPGATSFDLGGGHLVETLPVRGHSSGGTVYLVKKESLVFSGDALGSGFGQAFGTVERLEQVAQDSQNLVDYIKAHYAPYERYALRVYTGHSWQNTYGGFLHPNKASSDIGYLDWRFIQDVAACANGILQGKWLVEGSGIRFMGTMVHTDAWGSAAGRAIMVSGIGTIILPLEVAYQAAGLPMPPGGPGPLDPSVKRTAVQAGKATGFLYQPAVPGEKARIGVFVMHFGSDYSNFSACTELSRRGYTVLCTRNSGGGLNEILPDVKSSVEYLRSVGGVKKVVLWGHSGGVTLMTAYQLMAENGVNACQGPEKISKCPASLGGMSAADGMILADANWGNAAMTLLSIDPAVIDERDPARLDEDVNLFNPKNGYNAEGNSNYSPEFIKKWQGVVGRRNNAVITSMLEKVATLSPESTDDVPIVVYGANSMGPNNKLFPQDVRLMAHTVKPWPLIHADGSVTTQIVHSVRVPSGRPSSPLNGALSTTVRRYLTDNAVRVTSGFGYDGSSIYGVDWASSYASTPGNVEQIRVPSLFMGMTGGYEYLAAETIYEHSAARDKSLAFVEGASHVYGTCRPCETTPGQFGDTIKTLYDYVDRWLGQTGRF